MGMGAPSVVGLTMGAWLQPHGVLVSPWQQAQPPYGEGLLLNCSSGPRSKLLPLWGPESPQAGKTLLSAVTEQGGEPGWPVLFCVFALQSLLAHIF